jgi:O-antigen ligase
MIFFSKGEGLRNILLFGSFFLWLFTIKERNLSLLKDKVSILFFLFVLSMFISSLFSYNPSYSFLSLREEALKMMMVYPVTATVLDKKEKFKILQVLSVFTSFIIASIGFYSYFTYDLPMVKPHTEILHAWHNKFAFYLNIYHPFVIGYLFSLKNKRLKLIVVSSLILTIFALFMSTSRGGYLGLLTIVFIWLLYFRKGKKMGLKSVIFVILIFFLIFSLVYNLSPFVKSRIQSIQKDIFTMNNRVIAWKTGIEAALNRPIVGWGIGGDLFKEERIYKLLGLKPPPIGPHNLYVRIFFHQGFLGLVIFLFLIFYSIRIFLKEKNNKSTIKGDILISTIAAIIGNYIIHCMFEDRSLIPLTIILGIGIAGKYSKDEDSNS